MREDTYPALIRPLSEDEGGGWLVEYPDLPGCMSDGETPEEALQNGRDAVGRGPVQLFVSCRVVLNMISFNSWSRRRNYWRECGRIPATTGQSRTFLKLPNWLKASAIAVTAARIIISGARA